MVDKRKLLKSFAIKALLFLIGWKILFVGFILPSGTINNALTIAVAKGTGIGGEFFGYKHTIEINEAKDNPSAVTGTVYLNNEPAVLVGGACNGLELFALYVGFIVCFPGPFFPKLFFSVAGTVLLFFTNIMREILLAFNYMYFRSSFDFNHHYTYAIAVYLIVFLIWRYWLNNFSALGSSSK